MKKVNVTSQVNQPDSYDYNKIYFKMPISDANKEKIFEIITHPENIRDALIFADVTGSSPIAFYERRLQAEINKKTISKLTDHEKQFVGTSTCLVMESNGWEKNGNEKQRFTKGMFSSGQRYIKSNNQSINMPVL